jgi:hypothetical protein
MMLPERSGAYHRYGNPPQGSSLSRVAQHGQPQKRKIKRQKSKGKNQKCLCRAVGRVKGIPSTTARSDRNLNNRQ